MKKIQQIISLTFVILLITNQLSAQKINDYYINMPDIINPVISKKQRSELLEYYKANMGDSIKNRFDSQTHLLGLDSINGYISVKNTDISSFEMKLIENGTDTLIGIIKTVCAPICQSTIDFYSTKWEKQHTLKFSMPKASDWIAEYDTTSTDLTYKLSTHFISLSFNPENGNINAMNNSLDFLDIEDKERLIPLMHNKPIVYKFSDGKWIKE